MIKQNITMKKYLLYTIMLLSALSFDSCKDDDTVSAEDQREFMTMFRKDDNTGRGDSDPYNSQTITVNGHNNSVHLYWYGVDDCKGYEIKYALQPNVSSVWQKIGKILKKSFSIQS